MFVERYISFQKWFNCREYNWIIQSIFENYRPAFIKNSALFIKYFDFTNFYSFKKDFMKIFFSKRGTEA